MKVACCQIAPRVGARGQNRIAVREAIRSAVDAGARIVVLPELSTSGYVLRSEAEARELALRPGNDAFDDWSEGAARGDAVVIGGFAELGDDDLVYDSAAVVDASGMLAIYRKAHLWLDEPRFFAVGDKPPPVIETRAGRIGVAICYDLFFPEVTRDLACAGAEIIVAPTCSPVLSADVTNADIGIAVVRAAAHVNRVFIAVCDRCGTERGTDWAGRSVIVDPDGRVLSGPPGDRAEMLLADCELALARDKVVPGTANDVFGDRRPELYGLER
jgi:predicted amidohydrolase